MPRSNSGRFVIDIDPGYKKSLYRELDMQGLTLRERFIRESEKFVKDSQDITKRNSLF